MLQYPPPQQTEANPGTSSSPCHDSFGLVSIVLFSPVPFVSAILEVFHFDRGANSYSRRLLLLLWPCTGGGGGGGGAFRCLSHGSL